MNKYLEATGYIVLYIILSSIFLSLGHKSLIYFWLLLGFVIYSIDIYKSIFKSNKPSANDV